MFIFDTFLIWTTVSEGGHESSLTGRAPMRSSASAGPSSRTESWIRRTHAEDRRAHDAVAGRLLRGAGPGPQLAPRRRGAACTFQRAARDHERLRGGPGHLRAHGSGLANRRPEPGLPADDARVRG